VHLLLFAAAVAANERIGYSLRPSPHGRREASLRLGHLPPTARGAFHATLGAMIMPPCDGLVGQR
jgi:hypothetical protein